MDPKKTPNYLRNLGKEEQNWRHHPPWFQTIVQSYGTEKSVIVAEIDQWNKTERPETNSHIYS